MTYESCARSVNAALLKIKGVKAVSVNLEKGEVVVDFDKGVGNIPTEKLLTAINNIGYRPFGEILTR